MNEIRGLELLFNLEKKNFKSKEDCIVAAIHCLIINNVHVECAGIGDEWRDSEITITELLPKKWNSDQDVYSLRYTGRDKRSRFLLKFAKVEHILFVDVSMNEEAVASMAVSVGNHVSDDYHEYSNAYKNLDFLIESFHTNIMQRLLPPKKENRSKNPNSPRSASDPSPEIPPYSDYASESQNPERRPQFPRVGGSDLDPFGGGGGGGMLMDPTSVRMPARPTLPDFGVGNPGGLPRGAVPPGARFDPFMPPTRPKRPGRDPDPDRPPDYEDPS